MKNSIALLDFHQKQSFQTFKDIGIPIALYTFVAIVFWIATKFKVYSLASDFHFYHDYANQIFGEINSTLSNDLFQKSINIDTYRPSPFYSILFLLPITILGSDILYAFQAYSLGIIIIFLSYGLIKKSGIYSIISNKITLFFVFFISYPTFLHETLTNSTMAVCVAITLAAFSSSNIKIKTLLLVIASFVRPNFIVFLVSYLFVLLICKPKNYKKEIFYLLIPFASYFLTFLLFYSNYPGNQFNYIYSTAGLNFSFWENYANSIIANNLDIHDSLNWEPSFIELLSPIFSSLEFFNFVFQTYVLKYLTLLGAQFDSLAQVIYGFWIVRIYKTIFFVFISLPGILNIYKITINSLFLNHRKSVFLPYSIYTVLFLTFSSFLLGVTRYALILHGFFIFSAFDFWGIIRISQKK